MIINIIAGTLFFVIYITFMKAFITKGMTIPGAVVNYVIWMIGWLFIGPHLISEVKAQEISKDDVLGQFIVQISKPKYPEWGTDESTFPKHCEGSYRSKLNCARIDWEKKYTTHAISEYQ
jgi:hypothetical protein